MKMISANKLNRLWKNGVVAKMVAKTKVLKTIEEISANTNAENVAGAMAVKELKNNLTTQLSGNVRIISEGSGADAKYYAQIGADAASKKLLDNNEDVHITLLPINAFNNYRIYPNGRYKMLKIKFSQNQTFTSYYTKMYFDDNLIGTYNKSKNGSFTFDIQNVNTIRFVGNQCLCDIVLTNAS